MLDYALAAVRDLAKKWQTEEVDRRRKTTSIDPVADTYAAAARELLEVADSIDANTVELTAAQYGKLYKAYPQTVTAWIRDKKIPARRTANGWLIRRDTPPPARRRSVKP